MALKETTPFTINGVPKGAPLYNKWGSKTFQTLFYGVPKGAPLYIKRGSKTFQSLCYGVPKGGTPLP